MSTDRKIRSEWMDSLNNLKTFVTAHGALPTTQQDRKLHNWVRRQRWLYKNGNLDAAKEAMLQCIPGIFHFETPLVEQLAEFVAAHGRVPGSGAKDPAERALGVYLIFSLRPTAKLGTIAAETLAKAEQIPGAITGVRHPNQNGMLAALKEFTAVHGHMPSQTGSVEEKRLAAWVANNFKADRAGKTPPQQARHDAVAAVAAAVPTRRQFAALARIRSIEDACAANGWKAAGLDRWLQEQARSTTDEILRARIGKILEHPGQREYNWRKDLAQVIEFQARTGHLPQGWHEGHVYSWLATQRRDYRNGTLAQWKVELLENVPDALPRVRRRAA